MTQSAHRSPAATLHTSRDLYLRLLGYVRPYWRIFALSIVLMAASAATEPAFPALMKPLLDGGFSGNATYPPWLLPLLIVGIFLLRGTLGFCADYAMSWVSNKIVLDLRNDMFKRLVQLPTDFFDNQSSGTVMSRIAYDVMGVTSAATNVVTTLIKDSLAVIGLLAWMFWLNWQLSLLALLLIPVVALIVRTFSSRLRATSRAVQRAMGEIMHVLEESIEAHKVVKIFGGQSYEIRRFAAASSISMAVMKETKSPTVVPPVADWRMAMVMMIASTIAANT